MQTYRTLIIDIDSSARQELAELLGDRSDIEIIRKCEDGSDAIKFINSERPDLIFLEVEIPGANGFDVIKGIDSAHAPIIILMSYHKDFAVQAFEVEALDYLQKPFDSARITRCIDRIKRLTSNGIVEKEDIGNLVQELKEPRNLDRFIIKQSGEYHLVRTEDVIWIEADGNYSRIITQEKKFMVRYTLSGFNEQLNSDKFYRISRSQIVNLEYVVKIKDHLYGNYIIELKNGVSLKMSKNYKHLLEGLKNF